MWFGGLLSEVAGAVDSNTVLEDEVALMLRKKRYFNIYTDKRAYNNCVFNNESP